MPKKRARFKIKDWTLLREAKFDTIAEAARVLSSNEKILRKIEEDQGVTKAVALRHLKRYRDQFDRDMDIYQYIIDPDNPDRES